jgi:hypothetical protein
MIIGQNKGAISKTNQESKWVFGVVLSNQKRINQRQKTIKEMAKYQEIIVWSISLFSTANY